jgi:transaldolase
MIHVYKRSVAVDNSYLSWMAAETKTLWNNDSAIDSEVDAALAQGAIGVTTNPPLSWEALTTESSIYGEKLAAIDKNLPDDEFAFLAMTLVADHFSKKFMALHNEKGGFYGCVRAQVAPKLRSDAAVMLEYGKRIAAIGKNMMVKIPGSTAGIWVLEELAALGIATNPTVVVTVSQAIAAAEAFERGTERAKKAGIAPAWSACAIVMGRTQDYLASLNTERKLGISTTDLEWAVLAIVKRSYGIFKKRGYRSMIMPAAFRAPIQVEQLTGGEFCETIHPKIQADLANADRNGTVKREIHIDSALDEDAVKRVSSKLPEFVTAYDPVGLRVEQFDSYGATTMTLDGFHQGWQKLVGLK